MAVKAHFLATGLTMRIHKRSKCLPLNALSLVEVQNLVRFLNNYAETHAILLPGRIPGYKRDDIQLLPTCTTKKVSFWHNMRQHHTHEQSQLQSTIIHVYVASTAYRPPPLLDVSQVPTCHAHYTYFYTLISTLLWVLKLHKH